MNQADPVRFLSLDKLGSRLFVDYVTFFANQFCGHQFYHKKKDFIDLISHKLNNVFYYLILIR